MHYRDRIYRSHFLHIPLSRRCAQTQSLDLRTPSPYWIAYFNGRFCWRSREFANWIEVAELQQEGARRRWATVRAFVHAFVNVYPYAIFWQEHVCKKLYAPDGKGGKRDRAIYEGEFGWR